MNKRKQPNPLFSKEGVPKAGAFDKEGERGGITKRISPLFSKEG
jgi:hypothetical protein